MNHFAEQPEPVDRQPGLFSDEEYTNPEGNEPGTVGPVQEYHAERVRQHRPGDYAEAVRRLAEGKDSKRQICQDLKMTDRTLRAIERANPQAITTRRAKIADGALGVAALAVEYIEEDLLDPATRKKISTRDKAIVTGVLIDQAQKLTGQPTAIVGKLEAKPEHGALADYLQRMKTAEGQQAGTPAGMESPAGNPEPKGDAPGLMLPDPIEPQATQFESGDNSL